MGTDELTQRLNTLCDTHPTEMAQLGELLLSRGESVILLNLLKANGALLSGELAQRCGLSTGRIANLLRQLETKGLVARSHHERDRRKIYVQLSDAGRNEALRQKSCMERSRKALVTHLGEHDSREFMYLLERCLELYAD